MNNPTIDSSAAAKPKKKLLVWVLAALVLVLGAALVILAIFPTLNIFTSGKSSSAGKMCSDVNIDFFAGGNQDDSFASVVYAGARAAQQVLGANVHYIFSGWDSEKMVSQPPENQASPAEPGRQRHQIQRDRG